MSILFIDQEGSQIRIFIVGVLTWPHVVVGSDAEGFTELPQLFVHPVIVTFQ
jgi:hypothetical protein